MEFAVRHIILPLDPELYPDGDLQSLQGEFFQEDLIDNADEYGCSCIAYREGELELGEDEIAFVLFQAGDRIVASALLVDVDVYDEVEDDGYVGEMVFLASTMSTFEAPVTLEDLQTAIPSLKAFSKTVETFDAACLPAVEALLRPRLKNMDAEDFVPSEWIEAQLQAMMEEEED